MQLGQLLAAILGYLTIILGLVQLLVVLLGYLIKLRPFKTLEDVFEAEMLLGHHRWIFSFDGAFCRFNVKMYI